MESLDRCVYPGGAFVPEPQGGIEEQPALHPGPAAGHLPAPPHCAVPVRGPHGDPRGERVLSCRHGQPDQQDETDHEPL